LKCIGRMNGSDWAGVLLSVGVILIFRTPADSVSDPAIVIGKRRALFMATVSPVIRSTYAVGLISGVPIVRSEDPSSTAAPDARFADPSQNVKLTPITRLVAPRLKQISGRWMAIVNRYRDRRP